LFLFAIIYLKSVFGTSDISELKILIPQLAPSVQEYLWVGMFIAFAIKVPMLPFHTWLPDAHVQAPTFGSMMLAGILIKMGGYAMIKFLLPLFPEISLQYSHFIGLMSVVAIIYGSLVALGQKDIKKLIAYSSVAHMGYVTLGIFVPCGMGYNGAVFQMISHGIISSALFMCVGFIYERFHTLEITKIHSLATRMRFFSIAFMIFTLGSIGLPGTSGFIGEFLTILSALSRENYFIYGVLASTGVVLGAIYMLLLYKKVFMEHRDGLIGDVNESVNLNTNKIENVLLVIFIVAVIYFGVQPMRIISKIDEVNIAEYSNCNVRLSPSIDNFSRLG
jgi:NADH-quinone oxidoreductase subunit M